MVPFSCSVSEHRQHIYSLCLICAPHPAYTWADPSTWGTLQPARDLSFTWLTHWLLPWPHLLAETLVRSLSAQCPQLYALWGPRTSCTLSEHSVFLRVCVCVFSHVWFFVTPWTIVHQASLSMEFFRQEYWSQLPFPTPGIEPASLASPASAGGFFFFLTLCHMESPCIYIFVDFLII